MNRIEARITNLIGKFGKVLTLKKKLIYLINLQFYFLNISYLM